MGVVLGVDPSTTCTGLVALGTDRHAKISYDVRLVPPTVKSPVDPFGAFA